MGVGGGTAGKGRGSRGVQSPAGCCCEEEPVPARTSFRRASHFTPSKQYPVRFLIRKTPNLLSFTTALIF